MRPLIICLFVICVTTGSALVRVSVSPVIIEADDVHKGALFRITCRQDGEDDLDVQLAVALFDQEKDGNVRFLEDPQSVHEAAEILGLAHRKITLQPLSENVIEVEILRADFSSCYAVLFIKPEQAGTAARLAVLFLLATEGFQEELVVSSWRRMARNLELTIANEGERHGLWRGELLYYDAWNNLGERVEVQSGIVLAGRSRDWQISMPSWVKRVEVAGTQR